METTPEQIAMRSAPRQREPWLKDGDQVIEADGLTDLLDEVFLHGPNDDEIEHALGRVEASLESQGMLTLFYDVVTSTPFGPIYIAVTELGVAALGFDQSEQEFIERMQKRHRSVLKRAPARVEQVVNQLQDYFAGQRERFDLPLDLRSLTPFQHRVLTTLQKTPPGETISYGGLARRMGKPGSARAVGRALGSNPIPIIIPCHRALAADGSLGGYSGRGGVRTKQALLELEGARI